MIKYSIVLFFLVPVFASPSYKDVKVTRWVSPDGSRPTSYSTWQTKIFKSGPFQHGPVYTTLSPLGINSRGVSTVELLVNADLYQEIKSSLSQYIQDLEERGFAVIVDTVRQGTPEDIRGLLQSVPDLEGAVLVGDLPVPWFQMLDDFEQDGTLDGYEEFPVDLFYMDLDGIWTDSLEYEKVGGVDTLVSGSDGIFDRHTGNLTPEIWVGRLTAITLGNEKFLIEQYLDKVHRYRQGDFSLSHRALIYVDDDWNYWADEFNMDLDSLYKNRTLVFHPETTVADDYRARLRDNYEWVSVFVHSWPGGHRFAFDNHNDWSWMYSFEIPSIDPQAFFYNLFACSNCRFIEPDYMGGRYIFAPTYGLAAIGTTKSGSMLGFKDFYDLLGEGKNLGQAFRDWFSLQPLDSIWARSWFYGMTLLGDPTLEPNMRPDIVFSDSKGLLSPSSTSQLFIILENRGALSATNVQGRLFTESRYITILDSLSLYGTIYSDGDTAKGDGFEVSVAGLTPIGTEIPFTIYIQADRGYETSLEFTLRVRTVAEEPADKITASAHAQPNPFQSLTKIEYHLPQSGFISLAIYNPAGIRVKTLVNRFELPGIHRVVWDGSDASGSTVSSGVYFYRLQSPSFNKVEKIIKIRR